MLTLDLGICIWISSLSFSECFHRRCSIIVVPVFYFIECYKFDYQEKVVFLVPVVSTCKLRTELWVLFYGCRRDQELWYLLSLHRSNKLVQSLALNLLHKALLGELRNVVWLFRLYSIHRYRQHFPLEDFDTKNNFVQRCVWKLELVFACFLPNLLIILAICFHVLPYNEIN